MEKNIDLEDNANEYDEIHENTILTSKFKNVQESDKTSLQN